MATQVCAWCRQEIREGDRHVVESTNATGDLILTCHVTMRVHYPKTVRIIEGVSRPEEMHP